jgi:hypothetical protein
METDGLQLIEDEINCAELWQYWYITLHWSHRLRGIQAPQLSSALFPLNQRTKKQSKRKNCR